MKAFTDIFQYENGAAFPNTKAVTSSGPDSFDGTEYNKAFVDEIMGFFQAALLTAGVTPNGTTDTAQANQVITSIGTINKTIRQGRFDVWPTTSAKDGYVDCMIKEYICPSVTSIPETRKYTEISFQRGSTYNGCDVKISPFGGSSPYKQFITYLSWDVNSGVSPLIGTSGQPYAYIPSISFDDSPVATYQCFVSYDHTATVILGGVSTRCIKVVVELFQSLDVSVAPTHIILKNCDLSFQNNS